MNTRFQEFMLAATRLTQSGRLKEATDAIRRALGTAPAQAAPAPQEKEAAPETSRADAAAAPRILDGCEYEVVEQPPAVIAPGPAASQAASSPVAETVASPQALQDETPPARPSPTNPPNPATFMSGVHTHERQTRHYKLYVPPGSAGRQCPLVVMLHGCTQDPDDFAAGTRMNELAREEGFFVLYPAQSKNANPSRCWNWFNESDQQRDSGETALLASMTRAVMKEHDIDPQRVYIAGLSAGGAMAAITASAYPELFAAVGVHSGLPCGAAKNLTEALMAMKTGSGGPGPFARSLRRDAERATPVPTIVFHGDQDRTVNPRNGEKVIAAALNGAKGSAARLHDTPHVEQGASGQGMRYTRSTHRDANGHIRVEHWVLHGAGHAWSGGDDKGSYTDARGPDATREMLRFFMSHSKPGEDSPLPG
jgi:poly(hydroxyalkanoate) depolymerase family esterase